VPRPTGNTAGNTAANTAANTAGNTAADNGEPYDANPCYAPVGEPVRAGWAALAASLPGGVSVLAVDGPAIAGWEGFATGLATALDRTGRPAEMLSTSSWLRPWPQVRRLTSSAELAADPNFDRLPTGELAELFCVPARLSGPQGGLLVVFGPGAALAPHDVLWYADLPKRYAEAAVTSGGGRNLGQPPGEGQATTKRLFFVDWPLLDRHRDRIAASVDLWLDLQNPASPTALDGATTRATRAHLATRPFRTRPTFNTTPWGGHWAQRRLGYHPDALNTALGYELIAPEAGILAGAAGGPVVELPFQLVVSAHPLQMLGGPVHGIFGASFPIRLDYLDTFGGGNLSVHCHPTEAYMRTVFGWPYTQHESYYVMVGSRDNEIFLGLTEHADVAAFHRAALAADRAGAPFDIFSYVSTFAARPHQLFLIPAGTPHGSGAGNVVLEVSATPYLYSLRFYDWLRRDADGHRRPVHVEHAFANLDRRRSGPAVARDLVQRPRVVRQGDGWTEQLLGRRPEMFFDVRRLTLEPAALVTDDASEGFHVLNVVDGGGVVIEPEDAPGHSLAYAETIVIPAAVGHYTVRSLRNGPVKVVKALVR
jgi:mannose-6-phosphate isomerase class I